MSSRAAPRVLPVGILITRLIAPVGYVVVFSVGWYAYFLKSKKARQPCGASQKQD